MESLKSNSLKNVYAKEWTWDHTQPIPGCYQA